MAHQLPDPTGPVTAGVTGDVLALYLRGRATEFLRALRLYREAGGPAGAGAGEFAEAARLLCRSARRIGAALHTFRPALDSDWADPLRPELAWLSTTLSAEHTHAARLDRLLQALQRLTEPPPVAPDHPAHLTADQAHRTHLTVAPDHPASRTTDLDHLAHLTADTAHRTRSTPGPGPGPDHRTRLSADPDHLAHLTTDRDHLADPAHRAHLTLGGAKAGALLERRLNLARTRAHSAALQALGSSRFHAVADTVAVLASEVPLTAPTTDLRPLAAAAEERLRAAVTALPPACGATQDAHWHQVRLLLRLHRYAQGALHSVNPPVHPRLLAAARALARHRDAAQAATAAAQAAHTPRITPPTAYALGVLHADQRFEAEAARATFQQTWSGAPRRGAGNCATSDDEPPAAHTPHPADATAPPAPAHR